MVLISSVMTYLLISSWLKPVTHDQVLIPILAQRVKKLETALWVATPIAFGAGLFAQGAAVIGSRVFKNYLEFRKSSAYKHGYHSSYHSHIKPGHGHGWGPHGSGGGKNANSWIHDLYELGARGGVLGGHRVLDFAAFSIDKTQERWRHQLGHGLKWAAELVIPGHGHGGKGWSAPLPHPPVVQHQHHAYVQTHPVKPAVTVSVPIPKFKPTSILSQLLHYGNHQLVRVADALPFVSVKQAQYGAPPALSPHYVHSGTDQIPATVANPNQPQQQQQYSAYYPQQQQQHQQYSAYASAPQQQYSNYPQQQFSSYPQQQQYLPYASQQQTQYTANPQQQQQYQQYSASPSTPQQQHLSYSQYAQYQQQQQQQSASNQQPQYTTYPAAAQSDEGLANIGLEILSSMGGYLGSSNIVQPSTAPVPQVAQEETSGGIQKRSPNDLATAASASIAYPHYYNYNYNYNYPSAPVQVTVPVQTPVPYHGTTAPPPSLQYQNYLPYYYQNQLSSPPTFSYMLQSPVPAPAPAPPTTTPIPAPAVAAGVPELLIATTTTTTTPKPEPSLTSSLASMITATPIENLITIASMLMGRTAGPSIPNLAASIPAALLPQLDSITKFMAVLTGSRGAAPAQPAANVTTTPTDGASASNSNPFIQNLINDVEIFFNVIHYLDGDGCLQKLVCTAHSKQIAASLHTNTMNPINYLNNVNTMPNINQAVLGVANGGMSSLESNVVAAFDVLASFMPAHLPNNNPSNNNSYSKYQIAANLGLGSSQPEHCSNHFSSCSYSINDLVGFKDQIEGSITQS